MKPDISKIDELVNAVLIRPSDSEMSEIPDVSKEYILALEDECNALRSLFLYTKLHGLALTEEAFAQCITFVFKCQYIFF